MFRFDLLKKCGAYSYLLLLGFLVCLTLASSGCEEGSVEDPDGSYSVNIIFSPPSNLNTTGTGSSGNQAQSATGTAQVTRSGDLFSIFVESSILNIAFSGNIVANDMETTIVDSSGDTVTILLTFGDKRRDFSGTISFTSGTYTLIARKF